MAGYTRQSTDNIVNNNVIDADDLNAEYNALSAAFNASTGHPHDGTAGGGAPITKVGPAQDLVISSSALTPDNTNTLDIGTDIVRFKDSYFTGAVKSATVDTTGNATVGGTLGVTGVLTATGGVTGDITGNVTGDVTGDVTGGVTGDVIGNLTGNVTGGVTGDVTGNVTGTVSDVSNHDTGAISEGSNLYYTGARATAAATAAISVTDSGGDGSLTYSDGAITYTGPSATETRNHFSGGTGVTITDGSVAIGQSVGTSDNVTFNNATISGDLTVSGTTTTVNSNDVNIADATLTLNSDEAGTPSQDAGIIIERGTATNKSFLWDESEGEWTLGGENLVAGTFEGALTGDVTGNVTGNADTATSATTAAALTGDVSVTGDWTASATGSMYIKPTGDNVFMQGTTNEEQLRFYLGEAEQTLSSSDELTIASNDGYIKLKPANGILDLYDGANRRAYIDLGTDRTLKVYTISSLTGTASINSTFSGNSLTVANTVNAGNKIEIGADWAVEYDISGNLLFSTGGVNKMKLDSSGNLTVTGDITSYGTI